MLIIISSFELMVYRNTEWTLIYIVIFLQNFMTCKTIYCSKVWADGFENRNWYKTNKLHVHKLTNSTEIFLRYSFYTSTTFCPALSASSGEYPEFSLRRALRNSLFLSPRFLGWVTRRVFRISMGGVGDSRDPCTNKSYNCWATFNSYFNDIENKSNLTHPKLQHRFKKNYIWVIGKYTVL